jgi:glycerate-2-kinase
MVDHDTIRRAREAGLPSVGDILAANDSTNFLGPLGDLIVTGPTGTNVVDLTLLLAGDARPGRRRE